MLRLLVLLIELLRESHFGNDLVAAVLGPRRIVLIRASSAAPHSRANTALLIEPLGDVLDRNRHASSRARRAPLLGPGPVW